jgi:hypothetical protein
MLYEWTFTVSIRKNNNVRQHSVLTITYYAVTLSTMKPWYIIRVLYSQMYAQVIVLKPILRFT